MCNSHVVNHVKLHEVIYGLNFCANHMLELQ